MAFAATDFVWHPDESTSFVYTSNLATMASSIENRVGAYVYNATGTATATNTSNFGPYTSGNVIRAERNGKYVSITGTWACTTAGYLQTTTDRLFGNLPAGFRPKSQFTQLMQGSGYTSWLLTVTSSGELRAARASGTQGANYWMPISITYLAED